MRRILFIVFALMLVSSISFARPKACYYGEELIAKKCKKGDIIHVNRDYLPYFCDFNKTIINSEMASIMFYCVYVGYKRATRE